MLRVKLRFLDGWNQRRMNIAAFYLSALAGIPQVMLPDVSKDCESVWHLFVIRARNRGLLQEKLAESGVGTLIHYPIPPHLQPAYLNMGLVKGDLPLAEAFANEVLSLPMGPHMSLDEAETVASVVKNAES